MNLDFSFKLQLYSVLSITVYQMYSAEAAAKTRFGTDKPFSLLFIPFLSHQLILSGRIRNALDNSYSIWEVTC